MSSPGSRAEEVAPPPPKETNRSYASVSNPGILRFAVNQFTNENRLPGTHTERAAGSAPPTGSGRDR